MFDFTLREVWAYIHHHAERMKEQEQTVRRGGRGGTGSVQDLARFFNG